MNAIYKLVVFLFLLSIAALAAGLFGAVHNQVSFAVGPSYFFDLKFDQFAIKSENRNTTGAAIVGWYASWWMGLVAGVPAFSVGLFWIKKPRAILRLGLRAIFVVVMLTSLAAFSGFVIGWLWIDTRVTDYVPVPDNVSAPIQFLRAATMHEASYLGGIFGSLIALWIMIKAARSERRKQNKRNAS